MLCCQLFHYDLHKQHDATGAAYLIQDEEEGFAQIVVAASAEKAWASPEKGEPALSHRFQQP
ncbi:hypothetical protein CULC809_00115 [Corynebacterium ulcerans 809]|nr:hypothetical protein CULC809_00115 [Corynebacterium ulcerans 809]